MENWATPYQRNLISNKIEIVSQFEKLARLKKFVEDLDVNFNFFVIHRKPVEGIISHFVTVQNRIERIFGAKYLDFNEFLLKYEKLIYIAKRFNNKSYFYEKILINYWKAKIFKKNFKIKKKKNYKMFKEYLLKTTYE